MSKSKEQIYDEQISPLMKQIQAVCAEHKIAHMCTFAVPSETDPHLECTSYLMSKDTNPPDFYYEIYKIFRQVSMPAQSHAADLLAGMPLSFEMTGPDGKTVEVKVMDITSFMEKLKNSHHSSDN